MNKIQNLLHSLQTPNAFFNISYVLMVMMMVLLPFTTFFMWPIGILLMILWISEGNWREKWENFKTNNGIPYGFFLLGICLIPPLGLLNSTNMAAAWSTVECYLWFFFAPIIFLTASPKIWKKEHFDVLLTLFSVSVIIYMITLFIHGIYKTATTGDINYMHNYYFCYNSHHAYTALYLTFVYLLIFNHLLHNQQNMKKKHVIWLYGVELLLIVGVFCLYSRAGTLAFLFLQMIWCFYAIHLNRPHWKSILAITAIVFGLIAAMIIAFPTNRFTQEAISMRHKDDSDKPLDPRLIIWQAAWDASVKNLPWGVGTGDGSEIVMEQYHENGYWMERTCPLNAHNQFLSALLTNGIPGIILILLYFSVPLALAIKHRDMMLLSLFVLMLLNCLVECMFERRAGVDFFAIMIPLFLLKAHVPENSLTK